MSGGLTALSLVVKYPLFTVYEPELLRIHTNLSSVVEILMK